MKLVSINCPREDMYVTKIINRGLKASDQDRMEGRPLYLSSALAQAAPPTLSTHITSYHITLACSDALRRGAQKQLPTLTCGDTTLSMGGWLRASQTTIDTSRLYKQGFGTSMTPFRVDDVIPMPLDKRIGGTGKYVVEGLFQLPEVVLDDSILRHVREKNGLRKAWQISRDPVDMANWRRKVHAVREMVQEYRKSVWEPVRAEKVPMADDEELDAVSRTKATY
uniref:Uncharacterized protein n=1 Tax=Timema bartmani TaxID=61472 RepID=A0A7R9HZE3_9NEOP|nr:unnamed protein product [Timema bartmani]